jgi:hypothetical protein
MQIRQIIDKIDDYQLFVPAFQREYVWKRAHAKSLFSSLIKKYPTGTLLSWETTKPPELKGKKKYSPEMGAVKLILDGQQRITTIYMIMTGRIPPYYTQQDIKNDVKGLYVNIYTLELEYFKKQQMENNPLWVNLTDIFNGTVRARTVKEALRGGSGLDAKTEDSIDENFETIRTIQEREFPEQIIPVTANIKEAIDIFYVVNASGVNLTDAELALAQICGYWPDARELFKAKLVKLEDVGFCFKLDFLIYVLLAVLCDVGSDMKRLHSDENSQAIKNAWYKLESTVLDYVINILKTHAYVDHSEEINSPFAVVPLISYVFKKPNMRLTEDEMGRAVKWFYYSQVRQRYISQTPQKLDKDLSIVKSSESPFDEMLGIIQSERPLEITQEELVGRDVRHPLFGLMAWYFKSRNAVCFGTGVGLRQNMGAKYALEYDHIFPYSALRDNGYPVENRFKYALAQELTNRAVLTRVENRSKSATAAFDYLTAVRANFPGALEKQCIPDDPELWKIQNFEAFLDERRSILAGELNGFLRGLTEAKPVMGRLSIEDMIEEGEHSGLEFKASLRWDTEKAVLNRDLEGVVLKTIAAFNNAEGGTLLIGVSNKGTVVGLEPDYASLKGDKDQFELHLTGLVTAAFGRDYGSRLLRVGFERVGELEICIVEVKRGTRPLYLITRNDRNERLERLFVRSGNSSISIDNVREAATYVKERFAS